MARLILHVGLPKTGSSALQSMLARNVKALRVAGIDYPDGGNLAAAARGEVTSGNGVALTKLLNPVFAHKTRPERIDERIAEARRDGLDLLFSSETLSLFDPARFRPFVEDAAAMGYAVEAIAYVRAPIDFAISAYHQLVKAHGIADSFSEFLDRSPTPSQMPRLEKVAETLPPERLHVFNYDLRREDLCGHFLRTGLGIADISGFMLDAAPVNRSISPIELALFRTMAPVVRDPKTAALIGRLVLRGAVPADTRPRISPTDLVKATAMLAPMADIANRFLGQEPIAPSTDRLLVTDLVDAPSSEAEQVLAKLVTSLIERTQRSPKR